MVLLPDVSADEAQKVTVHLITYGYAVDYDKTSFGPNRPNKGMDVAETILDVQTPDQIASNSIDGNSLWQRRDLRIPPRTTSSRALAAPARTCTPVPKCWGRWWVWSIC